MNIYERVGRLEEALTNEIQQHMSTIALLRRIKEGDVDVVNVVMDERGWRLAIAKEPDLELRNAGNGSSNDGG